MHEQAGLPPETPPQYVALMLQSFATANLIRTSVTTLPDIPAHQDTLKALMACVQQFQEHILDLVHPNR